MMSAICRHKKVEGGGAEIGKDVLRASTSVLMWSFEGTPLDEKHSHVGISVGPCYDPIPNSRLPGYMESCMNALLVTRPVTRSWEKIMAGIVKYNRLLKSGLRLSCAKNDTVMFNLVNSAAWEERCARLVMPSRFETVILNQGELLGREQGKRLLGSIKAYFPRAQRCSLWSEHQGRALVRRNSRKQKVPGEGTVTEANYDLLRKTTGEVNWTHWTVVWHSPTSLHTRAAQTKKWEELRKAMRREGLTEYHLRRKYSLWPL